MPPCCLSASGHLLHAGGEDRFLGPEHVCHGIWNKLKVNDILMNNGVSEHVLALLEALVVGRPVSSGSELHTWN